MWQWVARGNIQPMSCIPQTEQHLPFGHLLLRLENVKPHMMHNNMITHLRCGYLCFCGTCWIAWVGWILSVSVLF